MLYRSKTDGSLRVLYPDPEFPALWQEISLSGLPDGSLLPQWHEDLALVQSQARGLCARIHGTEIALQTGDCLLINTRQLYSFRAADREGRIRMVLFHRALLESALQPGNPPETLLNEQRFRFLHWTASSPQGRSLSPQLDRLSHGEQQGSAQRLELLGLACRVLTLLCGERLPGEVPSAKAQKDADAVRAMLACVAGEYGEKLSLDRIAAAGGVSRSKCCKLFGLWVAASPMEYLSCFRLDAAAWMLRNTDVPIREVARRCGFPEQSYFTRLFKLRYQCTPGSCRKRLGASAQ